jgi:hypothetical protein
MQHFNKESCEGLELFLDEYRKKVLTRAMRIEGPFTVDTLEGTLECKDGYLAFDASGNPYPIDAQEFEKLYEEA